MEFSNLFFLYIWLPLFLAVYFIVPQLEQKNLVLTGFSLFLYAMGQPGWLLLLILLAYVNFRLAQTVETGKGRSLILPVAMNVGVLFLFKYLEFFLDIFGLGQAGILLNLVRQAVDGLNSFGLQLREPESLQPLGISFYTFSMISYLVDIYRGQLRAEGKFRNLLLYLTLFPKLLEGPIVRYGQLEKEISSRTLLSQRCMEGGLRFLTGLAKKVLLADYCGEVITELSAVGADRSVVGSWLSAAMFMFRIYYDFSGYSDMAIGLGRILGFTFCENFDLPYTACSVTEFWRRWHISLGSFFRDYVYIPLGGNRKGFPRQILNLLAVWLLTGLWHGASWNFVLWGLYFFALLAVEKRIWNWLEKRPVVVRRAMTLLLVLIGWVIFSHEDAAAMGNAFASMLGINGFAAAGVGLKLLNTLPLLVLCIVGCSGLPRLLAGYWQLLCGLTDDEDRLTPRRMLYPLGMFVLMCLLLWLCTVSLIGSTSAPSIYSSF